MEQKTEEMHEISYVKRDFLYNNGLINAFLLLQKKPLGEEIESNNDRCIIRWKGIEVALSQNSLSFACNYEDLFEIYKFLMEKYFSSILEETDHLRSYISKDLKEVLIKPRVNTKLFASRVKIKNLQKEYSVEKIPYTVYKNLKEDLKKKGGEYKNFDKKFWYGDEKKIDEEKDVEVVVFRRIDEIGKALSDNIVSLQRTNKDCMICGSPFTELLMKNDRKKDICLESQNLVFDFGYSPPINRDHRINKKIPLCFMCDMFYRLSVIDNYFYNNSIFTFDLFSLIRLKEIKEELGITIDYKPRENKIRTNVSSKDYLPISGPYSSLLNVLYHIYQKSKEKRGELFSELKGSQIIRFDMRSDSIDNCIFYNRLSYIFDLFEKIDRENLNNFFRTLIVYCYYRGQKKGSGIPREEVCKNTLFQFHIEPIILDVSYFYFS
ncbi:MAG TPA: hypothetical protein ENI51_05470, partial [Candidatus Atribacteria bacterium]|nr:hypothetical protein [Candidatus Atribacteria bacterium]